MNKEDYIKQTSPLTPPKEGDFEERFGYNTANPYSYKNLKGYRDIQKNNPTEAEKILWELLRNKKLGHKI